MEYLTVHIFTGLLIFSSIRFAGNPDQFMDMYSRGETIFMNWIRTTCGTEQEYYVVTEIETAQIGNIGSFVISSFIWPVFVFFVVLDVVNPEY